MRGRKVNSIRPLVVMRRVVMMVRVVVQMMCRVHTGRMVPIAGCLSLMFYRRVPLRTSMMGVVAWTGYRVMHRSTAWMGCRLVVLGVETRVVIQRCIVMWNMGVVGRSMTMFRVRRWVRVDA